MSDQAQAIKGLLEFTEEDLRTGLRPGDYHMKVRVATGSTREDDGTPELVIDTVVASGEQAGVFGPRHWWSLGEYTGERADGETFTITEDERQRTLIRQVVFAIHGGRELALSDDKSYDVVMMGEIARQIVSDEFYVTVVEDKNGFPKMSRFSSMEKPPKGFRVAGAKKNFVL